MAITVTPTGAALGAEVGGIDLRRISDADFAAIHRSWLEHLVLLFRGQSLNDDDLTGFSRRFGKLDFAPIQENGRRFVEGHPEIYVVSNVIENGEAIGSLGALGFRVAIARIAIDPAFASTASYRASRRARAAVPELVPLTPRPTQRLGPSAATQI